MYTSVIATLVRGWMGNEEDVRVKQAYALDAFERVKGAVLDDHVIALLALDLGIFMVRDACIDMLRSAQTTYGHTQRPDIVSCSILGAAVVCSDIVIHIAMCKRLAAGERNGMNLPLVDSSHIWLGGVGGLFCVSLCAT
jgi:hypothetical protein